MTWTATSSARSAGAWSRRFPTPEGEGTDRGVHGGERSRGQVVVVPVSDVDRSRRFYERLDTELMTDDGVRLLQFHAARLALLGELRHGGHVGRAGARSGAWSSPDGNEFFLQEITARLPGR